MKIDPNRLYSEKEDANLFRIKPRSLGTERQNGRIAYKPGAEKIMYRGIGLQRRLHSFGAALAVILGSKRIAYRAEEMVISRGQPAAAIIFSDGDQLARQDFGDREAKPIANFRLDAVVRGALLHRVAIDLAGQDEAAEWVRKV
jgi:hypothetical protein